MSGQASRGRVLVVEDEAYVRDSLVEILRARGFDASAAASVNDAIELLGRAPVDVVLSDLRMPGESGLDLVRRMQTTSPDVPVLILTGHGTVASAVECLKAGARNYVLKPVEPDALELALEQALEGRALRREVRYLRSAVADERSALIGEGTAWRRRSRWWRPRRRWTRWC
jgi:DNA-binding NtrC family response regulator